MLLWRIFWAWMAECQAGSRGDYLTAHEYLRLRTRLEAQRRARILSRRTHRS